MNQTEEQDVIRRNKELEEKVKDLEVINKKLATNWINSLIDNVKLMDESHPEWRIYAKTEIDRLKFYIK